MSIKRYGHVAVSDSTRILTEKADGKLVRWDDLPRWRTVAEDGMPPEKEELAVKLSGKVRTGMRWPQRNRRGVWVAVDTPDGVVLIEAKDDFAYFILSELEQLPGSKM